MIKINYYHSLIFFNLCIFLSAFAYLRNNSLIIFSLFLILTIGISHGSLDHIKGKKLLKILGYKSYILFYFGYLIVGLITILIWIYFLNLYRIIIHHHIPTSPYLYPVCTCLLSFFFLSFFLYAAPSSQNLTVVL